MAGLGAALMVPLVLASASPARLALLRSAGITPDVVVSGVDETTINAPDAATLCRRLAVAKARAVAATRTEGLVLGCDSLLEFRGQIHGKPVSAAEVRLRWAQLAGATGTLHTGQCLIDAADGRLAVGGAATMVRFGRPEPAELTAYIASGEPLRVAGAFTIDGRGAAFIDGIDGDPGTVIGLSLPLLRSLLAELGVVITDLWDSP